MEASSMADSGEITARGQIEKRKKQQQEGEEEKGGFIDKVKDFIHDIGEKIEETLGFGKPTASVAGFHLPCITLEKADVIVDVLITNPNPVPIPLVDIEYLIESDGRKLVSGTIPDAGTIHAHGSETLKIPISLVYKDIVDTYDDIEPGNVIPYRIKVALIADVPVLGRITIPIEKRGEIPIPYKPDVDVDKVEWDHLSLEETAATLHLKIENKNKFDLGVNHLEYELVLAETPVAKARLAECTEIGKEGVGYMDVPISFRPKDFGSALWDVIRGRGAGYSMKGKLEVDTPFGPMQLPFSKQGGKTVLKKKGDADDDDDDDEEKKKKKSHGWFSSRDLKDEDGAATSTE